MSRWLYASVVIAATMGATPFVAQAQGDWGLTRPDSRPNARPTTRSPRSANAPGPTHPTEAWLERYLNLLKRDPDQTLALQRLLDRVRAQDGNLDRLPPMLAERIARGHSEYALWVVLGNVERERDRPDAARAAFQQAIALSPHASSALAALARLEAHQGDSERARQLLEQALQQERQPERRRELLREAAGLALDAGDYDAAARCYHEIAARGGVYLITEYARTLASRGEHARAAQAYRQALDQLSGDVRVLPPVLVEYARQLLAADNPQSAIEALTNARRIAGSSGLAGEIHEVLLDAYRRQGRLMDLVNDLERTARTPSDLTLLGRVHDELGDAAAALTALRRAIALERRAIDLRLLVIRLLSREGRLDEVIEEYRALVRDAPREPRYVVELAQLLMETGARSEALRLVAALGKRFARDIRTHEALAQLYTRWGEHDAAGRTLTTLTRIAPADSIHWVMLGEQQMERGDREAAVQTWRRILRVGDSRAEAHVTLGQVLADHDMLSEAVVELRAALELDPKHAAAARALAEALERLGREQDAADQWNVVMALAQGQRATLRDARKRLLGVWSRTGQIRARLEEHARRFSISGTDPNARDIDAGRVLALGYDLLSRSRAPEATYYRQLARRTLERLVALEPSDVEALGDLAHTLATDGELEQAISVLERLVSADPAQARLYLSRMANHALQLYRDDDAIAYAERAVAMHAEDATAHQRLGDLYRARQSLPQAIKAYERAVAVNDRLFDVQMLLAELYLSQGQTVHADRCFRIVMRSSSDDDLVAQATRSAIQLHLGTGTLPSLETDLLPLAIGHPQRPVYRRLLVELYDALVQAPIKVSANTIRHELAARALKPLLEALADNDPTQRRMAVRLLSTLAHPGSARSLLWIAESDRDMELRRMALLAAGAVADESLVPRLHALADGADRRLRDAAAWALTQQQTTGAHNALLSLLSSSTPAVRSYAALGLGASKNGRALQPLITILRSDRSPTVRHAAALALAMTGLAEAREPLIAVVRSQREPDAAAAIVALGLLGDSTAAAALVDALVTSSGSSHRVTMWALRQLITRTAIPVTELLPQPTYHGEVALWQPTPEHLEAASLEPIATHFPDELTHALTNAVQGAPEHIEAWLASLTRAIEAGEESVQQRPSPSQQVAVTIAPSLTQLTLHTSPGVRTAAWKLLWQLPADTAQPDIDRALDDPDPLIRRLALADLASRHRSISPALRARLARSLERSAAWPDRLHLLNTLAAQRPDDVCQIMIRALREDASAFVRERAATVVTERCADTGGDVLVEVARRDPEPAVRLAAGGRN